MRSTAGYIMVICTNCKKEKYRNEFAVRKDRPGVKQPCLECISAQRTTNEYREKVRKKKAEKREKDPRIFARYLEKWKYGITKEELGNCCELCSSTNRLVIDHCHETNQVRGLLCTSCNSAIGKLGDNVDGLFRVIQYLDRKKYP